MAEEIRRKVEELHNELEKAAAEGNADAGELLGATRGYLANEEPTSDDHDSLGQQISEALVRFDADHPSIAGALRGVIDSLTAAGI